ncbi:BolA-like protein 3 [Chamberlinius hualienensis]
MAKRLSLCAFIRNQASRFLSNQNTEGERRLQQILQLNFPKANLIKVTDISGGCGAMYDIAIESSEFQGKSRVQQHRMVNEVYSFYI